jgi:hypothetical protein
MEILKAQLEEARATVAELETQIIGLGFTPFGHRCGGCDEWLATEADFASHFVIPNERYLNWGNCPKSSRKGA